jgi:DNA-binding transcriptional regulator YbjK
MTESDSPRKQLNYGDGREALLDASVRVVARGGLRALTYRNVATEAGVAHGLVRHYFGNRDVLVKEALEHATKESLTESGLEEKISSIDYLAKDLVAWIHDDPDQQIFQYELILQSVRQLEMQPAVKQLHKDYREAMKVQLEGLGFGDDPDLANLVFAAMDGLVFQQVALRDKEVMVRALEKLRDLLRAYKAHK